MTSWRPISAAFECSTTSSGKWAIVLELALSNVRKSPEDPKELCPETSYLQYN